MKQNLLLYLTLFVLSIGSALGQAPFITTWTTTTSNETITIPTNATSTYSYTVDWGDGSSDTGVTGDAAHEYATAGVHTVSITGDFPRILFNNGGDKDKITSIVQWGDIAWTSMQGAFWGCSNLTSTATDAPDLSGVTSLRYMFYEATQYDSEIGHWDVSNIMHMAHMFAGAEAFNGDISGWDVSSVIFMQYMFAEATSFNQNISSWDVNGVTHMSSMFREATAFNQNIGSWDVSTVIYFANMFQDNTLFNQDISGWDVSSATTMQSMFQGATAFNQNINTWDVSSVTDMQMMFQDATAFNQDLNSWDVSSVTRMDRMFLGASLFDGNVSSWDVSSVISTQYMFYNAPKFNQDVSAWDMSAVQIMSSMFGSATVFNQDISGWDVSGTNNLSYLFQYASAFDQDLSSWDITNKTSMDNTFSNSGMSRANYDATLIGWASQAPSNSLMLGATGLTYCDGEAARTSLINDYHWTILNDAKDCPDETPPAPSVYTPEDNSTNVSRSANLVLEFDEEIALGSGTIRIGYVGITGQKFADYVVPGASEVTVQDNQLIIDPATDLPAGIECFVSIPSGVVKDLSDNVFAGFTDEETWSFTTIDDIAPLHQSLTPYDGSTYGTLNTSVSIGFNEDVREGTGTVSLYKADGTFLESVTTGVGDSRITFPATFRSVVDFDAEYEELQEYYIVVSAGAYEDLAGNAHAGIAAHDWQFTANARPHVETVSPTDGATGVALDASFTLTLDMPVSTDADAQLLIKNYDTDDVIETIGIGNNSYGTGEITFSPSSLTEGLHAYVQFSAGRLYSMSNGEDFIELQDKDEWDFTVEVLMTDQIITFDAITDKVYGDEDFILSASSSSGLDVSFSVVSGPATIVSDNMVRITGTGTVEIAADQAGDESYNAASQVVRSFTVAKANQVITFDPLSDKIYGDADFELSSSSGSGLDVSYSVVSGPATIVSGNTVSITGAGTVEIAANQAGDDNYNAAVQVVRSFNVAKADQVISITPIADKLDTDVGFDIEASTTSELELFYEVSGPADVDGDTISLTGATGTVTVTVSQAGNENYNAASEQTTFLVTSTSKTNQTITFDALADKVYGDADFELTASASSGLDVKYSLISGPATVTGNTVSITGVGTVTIAANQEGDDVYNPAVQVEQSFTVSKASQVITISAIEDKLTTDEAFVIAASTTSGLQLAYEVSGPATLEDSLLTLDGTAGTVTVTVSQAGNENYEAVSESVSFEVTEPVNSTTLDAIETMNISFYPNPVTDKIYVSGIEEEAEVWLYDLRGVMVLNQKLTPAGLTVSHLHSGTYVLKLSAKDLTTTTRIVIQ